MISIFSQLFESITGGLGIVTAIVAILIGSISLFFGRRLYWVFVGSAGFLVGLVLGPALFNDVGQIGQWLFTLLIAVIFAGLSIVLTKSMIAIAGAAGLGIFIFLLTDAYLPGWAILITTIIGVIAGLLVSWMVFDWGLMLFSSLAGASLLTSGFISIIPRTSGADLLIFLFLFMIGFSFQIIKWTREQSKEAVEKIEHEQVQRTNIQDDEPTDEKKK